MPTILELPDVRERVAPLSVEAYEALAEMGAISKRAELIRGYIVNKMPRSPLHRMLTQRIFLFFVALARVGLAVFIEAPLRLADSEPEPDVMLVHGNQKEYDTKHPTTAELVVEVAVSSVALDRENASLYAEASVTEYWIVLALEQQIEVYRQPVGGVYQQKRLYSADETLTCESVPGLQIALSEWFA